MSEFTRKYLEKLDPNLDVDTLADYVESLIIESNEESSVNLDDLQATFAELLSITDKSKISELIKVINHHLTASSLSRSAEVASKKDDSITDLLKHPQTESSSTDSPSVLDDLRNFIKADNTKLIKEQDETSNFVKKDLDAYTVNILKDAGVRAFQDKKERLQLEISDANYQYSKKQQDSSASGKLTSLSESAEVKSLTAEVECAHQESTPTVERSNTVMNALQELNPEASYKSKFTQLNLAVPKPLQTPGEAESKKQANEAIAFIRQRATASSGRLNFSALNFNMDSSAQSVATDNLISGDKSTTSGKKGKPVVNKKLKEVGKRAELEHSVNDEQNKQKLKSRGVNERSLLELQDFL